MPKCVSDGIAASAGGSSVSRFPLIVSSCNDFRRAISRGSTLIWFSESRRVVRFVALHSRNGTSQNLLPLSSNCVCVCVCMCVCACVSNNTHTYIHTHTYVHTAATARRSICRGSAATVCVCVLVFVRVFVVCERCVCTCGFTQPQRHVAESVAAQ